MKKELRRIGTKKIECNEKEAHYLYFTWSSTVPATLMQCSNCSELFIYDEDAVLYGKPLEVEIKNKKCPTCNQSLSVNLTKYHFDTKNVKCNQPNVTIQIDSLMEIYNLYT